MRKGGHRTRYNPVCGWATTCRSRVAKISNLHGVSGTAMLVSDAWSDRCRALTDQRAVGLYRSSPVGENNDIVGRHQQQALCEQAVRKQAIGEQAVCEQAICE